MEVHSTGQCDCAAGPTESTTALSGRWVGGGPAAPVAFRIKVCESLLKASGKPLVH
jgi:hypothetical protein